MNRRTHLVHSLGLFGCVAGLALACGSEGADAEDGSGGSGEDGSGGVVGSGGASTGGATTGGAAGAATGGASCTPEVPERSACPDLLEGDFLARSSYELEVEADTTLSSIPGVGTTSALRLETEAGFLVTLTIDFEDSLDVSDADELRVLVRALNENAGWQGNLPVVELTDGNGAVRALTPSGAHFPIDGTTWKELRVPLEGGNGFVSSGDAIDETDVVSVSFSADTWDSGFRVDFDALGFVASDAACAFDCVEACHDRGTCDPDAFACVCEVGAEGDDCATCRDGFELEDGHCVLEVDTDDTEWPNEASFTNGDAWLAVHHQEITKLRPRVLVLNFVNPSQPADVVELVEDVIEGFAEGSRPLGAGLGEGEALLEYELVGVRDLRDGVGGRPPAPVDYEYENSTLYPRRPEGETANWGLDYGQLFSDEFAEHLGIDDPDQEGGFLNLCEAIESGAVHELWLVGSGDVPDASAAEVLEHKQRYARGGQPIAGSFDPCAGNGCFDDDVPRCARSVRIGFVNYARGPGCYLHSQGHGLESTGTRGVIPELTDWFVPFAGFDLDTRYDLPGNSFYALVGEDDFLEYPTPDSVTLTRGGNETDVDDYVATCGNVHFPPNAGDHYDYGSSVPVASTCADFGRHVLECREPEATETTASLWSEYEELSPDCGGAFLVHWYQSMPSRSSEQYFDDGRPMKSVWPYWFY